MKTIHRFIIKSYIWPFIATFFIVLFILLMQFVWKYIDDLVGKGLEWSIIGELLLYQSASLLPLALPLAVLVSSIMTFGALGEKYELVALKASGISLIRIMYPLIISMLIISGAAFLFSNYVIPVANLKSSALLYDITRQKPTLNLREGVFFTGIEGYSIKVAQKEDEGQLLKDIIIYDHTQKGKSKMIIAKEGGMINDEQGNSMTLLLRDGKTYEELRKGRKNKDNKYPFVRSSFQSEKIIFDLSTFELQRTKEDLFKDHYKMMSVGQLDYSIDSLYIKLDAKKKRVQNRALENYTIALDSLNQPIYTLEEVDTSSYYIDGIERNRMAGIIETAINLTRTQKTYYVNSHKDIKTRIRRIAKHDIEWHRKFVLSFACMILFFIGAPLGAIIRKGGLGMPFVVSVFLFIIFHVISITGEKMTRSLVLIPVVGMWISTVILLPMGIFLTYKSTTDSTLFNIEKYIRPFQNLLRKLNLTGKKS